MRKNIFLFTEVVFSKAIPMYVSMYRWRNPITELTTSIQKKLCSSWPRCRRCFLVSDTPCDSSRWWNSLILWLATSLTFLAVIWSKTNPQPWNTVKPNESTKLLNVNQNLDQRSVFSPSYGLFSVDSRWCVQLEAREDIDLRCPMKSCYKFLYSIYFGDTSHTVYRIIAPSHNQSSMTSTLWTILRDRVLMCWASGSVISGSGNVVGSVAALFYPSFTIFESIYPRPIF